MARYNGLTMEAGTDVTISVSCPTCGERLAVRAEDRGKLGRCRTCDAVFRIGVAAHAMQPGAASEAKAMDHAGPVAPKALQPVVPFRPSTTTFGCSLCATRITVALANVGKKVKCPDCGRVNLIPPPEVIDKPKPPAALAGPQLDLWGLDEAPATADLAAGLQKLHPVVCQLCQTLMYAKDDQVGKKLKCPDCGTLNLAERRVAVKPKGPVMAPDGEEYQLDETSAPPPRPAYRPVTLRDWRERDPDEAVPNDGPREPGQVAMSTERNTVAGRESPRTAATKPLEKTLTDRPRLPRLPLVQGFWRMLLTSEVLVRWIGLSIAVTVAGWFLSWVLSAMGLTVFLAIPLYAVGCAFAGAWLITAMPVCLEIVTESSEGSERLHDPPNPISPEFGEAFFVIIAAALSVVPAALTIKATGTLPAVAQNAIFTGTFLLVFPVILLSNLEQGSAFAVFSTRVVASLARCAGPWMLFYILSAVLASSLYASLDAILSGPPWLLWFVPSLLVAAMLVYMRLVGRLAWWLAETMPAADDRPHE